MKNIINLNSLFEIYRKEVELNIESKFHKEAILRKHIELMMDALNNMDISDEEKDTLSELVFFHDIGKNIAKTYTEKMGRKGFWFHDQISSQIYKEYLMQNTDDKKDILYKTLIVYNHMIYTFKEETIKVVEKTLPLKYKKLLNILVELDNKGRISDEPSNIVKVNETEDYIDVEIDRNKISEITSDVILITGPIASGKSTLSKNISDEYIKLSSDDMAIKLYNKKHGTNYKYEEINSETFKEIITYIINNKINTKQALIQETNKLLKQGKKVAIDTGFIGKAKYTKFIKALNTNDITQLHILFVTLDEIKERNKQRNITIKEETVEEQYYRQVVPMYFDKIKKIYFI